jgi:pSer/pThr/pTyr-binding forkhead associated (FHA) protein
MAAELLGELVPVGGGDPIPLHQELLTIGRRSSCDICLNYQNISGTHCELAYQNGFWMIRDLNSSNGTKIKGERIIPQTWKALRPNEEIKIGSHRFTIEYTLQNSVGLEAAMSEEEDIYSQSLLEKAGLERSKSNRPGPKD